MHENANVVMRESEQVPTEELALLGLRALPEDSDNIISKRNVGAPEIDAYRPAL